MAGAGKGKMGTAYVDKAWKMMQAYESQPDFKSALDYIDSSFKIPKGASADVAGVANKKYADTVEAFQQQVNANPTKSKLEIAHDLVKSTSEEQIKTHADAMFGGASPLSGLSGLYDRVFGSKPSVASPQRPSNVPEGYVYNAKGAKGAGWYGPAK